jgi:general secretion pathway protein G
MDTGRLPNSLDELVTAPSDVSGWLGPYAKETELKDPFGHAYEYHVPGEKGDFDLVFLGKDGKPGGSSINADIKYE